MPPWRNGIRTTLKMSRSKGHVGSSPTGGNFRTPYCGVLKLSKRGLEQKGGREKVFSLHSEESYSETRRFPKAQPQASSEIPTGGKYKNRIIPVFILKRFLGRLLWRSVLGRTFISRSLL
jgi:hypothetical protein